MDAQISVLYRSRGHKVTQVSMTTFLLYLFFMFAEITISDDYHWLNKIYTRIKTRPRQTLTVILSAIRELYIKLILCFRNITMTTYARLNSDGSRSIDKRCIFVRNKKNNNNNKYIFPYYDTMSYTDICQHFRFCLQPKRQHAMVDTCKHLGQICGHTVESRIKRCPLVLNLTRLY